jgi:colanic acid/amylovoran biosynthesis glycosyltransferase
MKLAYLLSEYPVLEHTYLLREVRELRNLGWDIQTISVRKPAKRASTPSAVELQEGNATWYILGDNLLSVVRAQLVTIATRPLRYLRGLFTAWKFGHFHPRRTFLATAYFAEAVAAGHRLRKAGITHVHSVYSTTVAMLLATVFDVHLSMTIHGSGEFLDAKGFWIGPKVRIAQLITAISYFGKSQIMLWSEPSDWHKIEVVPLGIDLAGWQPAVFRERPEPFQLIAVGRIAAAKGYPLLLDAMAQLRSERKDVRLTLVGDGPERPQLEQYAAQLGISDRVSFAGWKTQDALRELYRNSDLCVLSSLAEGIPVVLMEAMATGVPCVATRITGIPELVRDGVDGRLVTPADAHELACAIAELMDNPGLRKRMADAGRAQIAAKFELHQNVEQLSRVLKERLFV